MTLRSRLLLMIGLSLAVLWAAASVWMLIDLRNEFRSALDERLAASARMVANLVAQLPQAPQASELSDPSSQPGSPTAQVVDALAQEGVACEVRLSRGGVLARTRNSPPDLDTAVAGFSTRTIQGSRWRTYTLEQDGIRITTADSVDRRTALLKDIVVATSVPFLIAMAGSLLALALGVRHGLAPLKSITTALADRDPAALQRLPDTRVPGELRPLVSTINTLLDRIQQAMERERRFTGDAAHELRTPLTAVKTHIQVARLAKDGSDTAVALAHAEQGVLRLQGTIEQLLMLTRVDGALSFDAGEAVTAREVAARAMQRVPDGQRERIVLHETGGTDKTSVPAELAVTALRNILDNALRYSPPHEPVILTLSQSGGMIDFVVDDSGPGMNETECARSLERFWRKGRGHGSGLGLSIVAAIMERHGGRFELRPRPEGGMRGRMALPVGQEVILHRNAL